MTSNPSKSTRSPFAHSIACAFTLACLIALACWLSFGSSALAFAEEGDTTDTSATEQSEENSSGEAESNGEEGAVQGEESAASSDAQEATEAVDSSSSQAEAATSVDTQENNLVDPTQRADNSFIYDTTIQDILDEPSSKDGQVVQFTGEAIGDCVIATPDGSQVWVMIATTEEGDDGGLSVLMSAEQAKQIDHYGRYGVTGSIVQVRGTFNHACTEHDGLTDVHATNVAIIAHGVEHPDEFNPNGFGPGLITIILGVILMAVFYFARERMR